MVDGRALLNHYGITTQFPTEWPAEKDQSDVSDDEPAPRQKPKATRANRAKSRYSVLERNWADHKNLVPGTEKTRDGVENLVQKDEPDALGFDNSVVLALSRKGLPAEDDERLRNRFLLSSTTFNPALYLSQVHSASSTQDLLEGLQFLSRSIDQKSASLKVLVESNFERFVRAKSVIDNVYTEMKNQGAEPEPPKSRPHSRHHSRTSAQFRNSSGGGIFPGSRLSVKPAVNEKKKHALTKESEYGVQGIKAPLTEVAVKAEELWGPALGGRDRENNLKGVLDSLEKSRDVFDVGNEIAASIKRKDFDGLAKGYAQAQEFVNQARSLAEGASQGGKKELSDAEVHQIVVTARMWAEVETQIANFKRGIWRDLTSVQANLTMSTDRNHQEDHVALISVLLELGVEDNPIWVWLLSRYDYLKNKITSTFERSRVEIEVFRRRLASSEKPGLLSSAVHFKSPSRSLAEDRLKNLDTGPILELWDLIFRNMSQLLSPQGGVLGEVIDFWDKAQSFIDGKAQRALPTGINGGSRAHHRLSSDGVRDLQSGAIELVDLIRDNVFAFFADPPIEDVSLLFSPAPADSPREPRTPRSAALSPFSMPNSRFKGDFLTPPPPSPKKGEAWEDFAFWPPYANSLSGVHYLSRLLVLLATASTEMAALQPIVSGGSPTAEKLKALLNAARERSARAICAAWNDDAQSCKVLEDWTRGPDSRDVTRMPSYFGAFEAFILSGAQKVLYMPGAGASKRGTENIVVPPPNKLLQMVRSQFVTSLYKALSGMVENAERPVNVSQNPWTTSRESPLTDKTAMAPLTESNRDVVDASSRNLRMLLTLSNLKALRVDIVPGLVTQFEADFSVKLTEESKTIYDVLDQIDARLFQSYTRPIAESLASIVSQGISAPSWAPTSGRPTQVRPYVYTVLLRLVAVHTEISSTASPAASSGGASSGNSNAPVASSAASTKSAGSANSASAQQQQQQQQQPPLATRILSHLLETTTHALLEAFRARAAAGGARYALPALMQATLDVEFVTQTLAQYDTERAAETQKLIYEELDRGTDGGGTRQRLKGELVEMKNVLKRLREGTRAEFACFKKQRDRDRDRDRDRERERERERDALNA